MNSEKKELWLFTVRFPYGRSEPFLENEIPYLCNRFDRVRLFPLFQDEGIRELPENCSVENLFPDPYAHAGVLDFGKYFLIWLKVRRFIRKTAPSKEVLAKQKSSIRARYRQALSRALVLKKELLPTYTENEIVLYSYWNYDWALSLSILKEIDPSVRFVTRMLGFDMFKFRSPDGWPAFRTFQLNGASANYIISRSGLAHMNEHYPDYADQYHLSFLATHDHGEAPWSACAQIRIVSCSNLVALKRVHLIIEALMLVTEQVHWTHFGDGPEMETLRMLSKTLPSNVNVCMKGSVANASIIEWYSSNEVDLFVHVSSTEGGAPVAIQEAASFGIPTIATNVGGIPEIVNSQTGLLLDVELNPKELADAIVAQHERLKESPHLRREVRAFWQNNFMADKVYSEFADALYQGIS